jgi:hypothetical protein
MLSIDVIPTHAYADLGDEWVRYQSARIQQKHLQVGRHFRLDLTGILRRLAISTGATRLNEALEPRRLTSAGDRRPVAREPIFRSAQVDAGMHARVVDLIFS